MRHSICIASLITAMAAQAQQGHGGQPVGWGSNDEHAATLPATVMHAVDRAAAEAEAASTDPPLAYRFGTRRTFQVDLAAQGLWTPLPDGGRICRYRVKSTGALMLSLQFSRFHLPWGGRLFVYDAARSHFIGAFTRADQSPDGRFATALLPGDEVVIEYREPAGALPPDILLESLTHAWRSFMPPPHPVADSDARDLDPGYQSLPCHNNVVCPVGADWQDQNRSVLWFVMPSGLGCNGTLLNNTAQDGKPYFLLANHCYQPTESQWVFYFNYQSPTCIGDTGQTQQTLSGSVLRALNYYADFCMVELDDALPPAFNAYLAGWDRGGSPPQSGATILNPQGDVKKIAIYSSPATSYVTDDDLATACWSVNWSSGLTEPGGSGAPIFDQNHRVVAHLVGGIQDCATASTSPTYGSKFSENWNYGSTPSSRLRDWLDPSNTQTALDGMEANAGAGPLMVRVKAMLQGPYVQADGNMATTLNDAGLLPLTEPYSALGYAHVGGGGESTVPAVLNATGNARPVDWVVLELRDPDVPANVLATRSALLRKDGLIKDTDGVSDVAFAGMAAGSYYVAVRHRNHLGIMTGSAQPLSGTASLINLTPSGANVFGGSAATALVGGTRCLWAGDVNGDGQISYSGPANDKGPIAAAAGPFSTSVSTGYEATDVNLDGVVKYAGTGNDRDALLRNLGGDPDGVKAGSLP
jgi:hypothetical protein